MAILKQRKGGGFYVQHSFRKEDLLYYVTYQIETEAEDFLLRDLQLRDGSILPDVVFHRLRDSELLYTGRSGPGVLGDADDRRHERSKEHIMQLKEGISLHGPTPTKKEQQSQTSGNFFYWAEMNWFMQFPTKAITWTEPPALPPYAGHLVPWQFFNPLTLGQMFSETINPARELLWAEKVWSHFESLGLTHYKSEAEFNRVIARLLSLARVVRTWLKFAYGGCFAEEDEMPDWFIRMPFVMHPLEEEYPLDGTLTEWRETVVNSLVYAENDRVYYALMDMFENREDLLILSLRAILTQGNEVEAYNEMESIYQVTGFSAKEMDALSFIGNRFVY